MKKVQESRKENEEYASSVEKISCLSYLYNNPISQQFKKAFNTVQESLSTRFAVSDLEAQKQKFGIRKIKDFFKGNTETNANTETNTNPSNP